MKTSEFYFRGDRNYLHGPSLFDYILNNYVRNKYKLKNIDFTFHKFTNKCCLVVYEEGIFPLEKLIGQYRDSETQLFIYETEDTITDRVPYDERGITGKCIVVNNEITIPREIGGYSFIDKVTAAYKLLLSKMYGNIYGKYIFARVILSFIPEGALSIKQERIISNRFFEGKIRQDDKDIGEIFFAAKKI